MACGKVTFWPITGWRWPYNFYALVRPHSCMVDADSWLADAHIHVLIRPTLSGVTV